MPIKLAPNEIKSVRDAIIGTFIDATQLQAALAAMLRDVGPEQDNALSLQPGRYAESAYTLVQTWNARGLIADLIGGLRRVAPHSPELKKLHRECFANAPAAAETVELQGFIEALIGYLPAAPWIDLLRARMRSVCRIELTGLDPPGIGTGFLVRPDLVLTAHHVIELLLRQTLLVETAVCRFEYLNDTDKTGTAVPLRGSQPIAKQSPPGGIEVAFGGAEPKADELDFALLRLERKIDGEPLKPAALPPAANRVLIVLQHPLRAPLRISLGRVTGFNDGGTRLRHSSATERGSSGAPCLNQDLDLVGLHNAARYTVAGALADYNTAVPMQLIALALAAKGVALAAAGGVG